jgi:hypothetical protein
MSVLRSSLSLLVAATALLVITAASDAQTRQHHTNTNNRGMQGGTNLGTSPTQSSINSAQNQARMIADRQWQLFAAKRRAEAAARMKAKAEGTFGKTTATKSTGDKSTAKSTTTEATTDKETPAATSTNKTDKADNKIDLKTDTSKKPETPKTTTTASK